MRGVQSENDIVSESMLRNSQHTLTGSEQVDTFDNASGQHSIANIKFVARQSPWQKALLSGDVKDAHRIIRAAMNLAEPATEETKHEMAKQFFRQLTVLVAKSDESEKQNIYHVANALERDPELKKAKEEVEQEAGRSVSEPTTEPASEKSTPRVSRSDSFKATPERGQTPVQGAEDGERYLKVVSEESKYSPFVNAVLGSTDEAEKMWQSVSHDSSAVAKAAQQLAVVLREIAGNDREVLEHYGAKIANIGVDLWKAVKKELKKV